MRTVVNTSMVLSSPGMSENNMSRMSVSPLSCSTRGGDLTLVARNTVHPFNRRAAPAGACPQAWGKKKAREREREVSRKGILNRAVRCQESFGLEESVSVVCLW